MKKAKLIACAFLLLFSFLYQGESFGDYYSSFENEYYGFELSKETKHDVEYIVDTLINASNRNNIDIFTISNETTDLLETKTVIYTTSSLIQNKLLNENYIREGQCNSILFQTKQIEYSDLSNLTDLTNIYRFNFIVNSGDFNQFQHDINQAGVDGIFLDVSKTEPIKLKVILVWGIVIAIYLLFTAYELSFVRKKVAVELTFGKNKLNMILENIILDSIFITAEAVIVYFVLSQITYVYYLNKISLIMLLVMLVFSSIIYLWNFKIDVRKAFSGSKSSRVLMSSNYFVRFLSGFFAIVLFSLNFGVIRQGVEKYEQKDFFEKYKNYVYLQLNSKTELDNQILRYDFYRYNFDNSILQTNFNMSNATLNDMAQEEIECIYINRNAVDNLNQNIRKKIIDEKVYFLFPEIISYESASNFVENNLAKNIEWINDNNYNYKFDYETVIYEEELSIVSIDRRDMLSTSKTIRNPVLIINNIDEKNKMNYTPSSEINITTLNSSNTIMYDALKIDIEGWLLSKDLLRDEIEISGINVHSQYIEEWNLIKNSTIINSILCVLVLLFEIYITKTIVRLEYLTNSKELAIKTILGYSKTKKFLKLWVSGVITLIFGTMLSFLLKNSLGIIEQKYIFLSTLLLFVIELFINAFYINKVEKSHIVKLVKGGYL